ncbi:MAG TPA: hypothetical protein VNG32_04935 [Candidatus Dormibacteraeota bacterium]|nr:hypothetical protein [Candidatus Dormibacteraeota bacterium]
MPGETASNEGGNIRLGAFAGLFIFVLGVEPKLNEDEKLHIIEQDVLPTRLLEGEDYDLVIYREMDFYAHPDPDEAFVSFAKDMSQGLGERALSEKVKYIELKPK